MKTCSRLLLLVLLILPLNLRAQFGLFRGLVVTNQGDSLRGYLPDILYNIVDNQRVVLLDSFRSELIFSAREVSMVVVNREVYEVVKHFKDGLLYQDKLVKVIYKSPYICVYYYAVNSEYLYYFPLQDKRVYYTAFNSTDATAYLTDYNKKMEKVFIDCEPVRKKILNGWYRLKEPQSMGPVQVVYDYEFACGSQDPDKYFRQLSDFAAGAVY